MDWYSVGGVVTAYSVGCIKTFWKCLLFCLIVDRRRYLCEHLTAISVTIGSANSFLFNDGQIILDEAILRHRVYLSSHRFQGPRAAAARRRWRRGGPEQRWTLRLPFTTVVMADRCCCCFARSNNNNNHVQHWPGGDLPREWFQKRHLTLYERLISWFTSVISNYCNLVHIYSWVDFNWYSSSSI